MINKIITSLSNRSHCQFELIENELEDFSFYKATSTNYHRFLIIVNLSKLINPSEFNQWVLLNTPEVLREQPAFAKNTDVIILFELDKLEDVVFYESDIFALEEDSYSFKKHVLYYSKEEAELLHNINIDTIPDLIKDQTKFNEYKKTPLKATDYGVASRIFIKLPFLTVPIDESELDDPCIIADNYLKKLNLLEFNNELEGLIVKNRNNYQILIEEYIRGKMANSQAED